MKIEHVLCQHPGINEAVVVAREDHSHKRLVAYVVPSDATAGCDATCLREWCAVRLPAYMVPDILVDLPALPKTVNQKIDRRALPPPPCSDDTARLIEPRSDTERALVAIWAEVLGTEHIGIQDEFYALGGNSLSAVRMLSMVETRLGKSVPLVVFMRAPTVASLARLLVEGHDLEASLVVPIQQGDGRPPLWFVHPVGGHVLCAEWLRRHMDPQQPILGIQARGPRRRAASPRNGRSHGGAVRAIAVDQPTARTLLCGRAVDGRPDCF